MDHHGRVSPMASRRFDVGLACTVVAVYGYRASCACGWRGRVRSTISAARTDVSEHRRTGC
jgi:hypothetical protein